jgi:NTE family protein
VLTSRNVRTPALLAKLWPSRWAMPDSAVRALADGYAAAVPWWSTPLRDNETGGPAIVTGATEVAYGVDWTFADPTARRPCGRIGDYRLGYAPPPPGLRLADVVAASCAFPPFFAPMALRGKGLGLTGGHPDHDTPEQRAAILEQIRLTDGGVYDNLGLEPVWKDHAAVLVSDGGEVFRARSEHTLWGRLLQILGIATGGGTSVRLRWLHAGFARGVMTGSSWSLGNVVPQGYPAESVDLIDAIRTDLDAFSGDEQRILERHGYLVADHVVREWAPGLIRIDAPLVPPHPEVAEPAVVPRALKDSAKRLLLGRW